MEDILTPTGWLMLEAKMKVILIDEGTIFAECNGQQFEYDTNPSLPTDGERAGVWIWGTKLYRL